MSGYPLDHRSGYMPVPRDLARFEPLMLDPSGNALRVYLVLLARASHKPRLAQGSHGPVQLDRGMCVCGTRELAKMLGVARNTAHRALQKLEDLGLIARKAGHLGSVVSLVNYGAFERIQESERDTPGATPEARSGATPGATPGALSNRRTEEPEEPSNGESLVGDERRPPAQVGLPLGPEPATAKKKTKAKKKPTTTEGYPEFKAHFDALFKAHTGGAEPRWAAAENAIASRLLKASGGLAEVIRRSDILYTSAPSWIEGRDIQTLSKCWDKLAAPAPAKGATGGYQPTGNEQFTDGDAIERLRAASKDLS